MKKHILLLIAGAISAGVSAQNIFNGGFESWSLKTLYEEPAGWLTSNPQSFMMTGNGNVGKDSPAPSGNNAVKLETVSNGNDTLPGMLIIGNPGPGTINGGIPYSSQPDSMRFFVKYNIQANDTAHIYVFFKNNGSMIGIAAADFNGSQSSYQQITVPVNWFSILVPDTMAAVISSSNMDLAKIPGSTLYVDKIEFVNGAPPVPNSDFENWVPVSSEEADGWNSINYISDTPSVTKTTGSYSGSYAMRIETVQSTPWGGQPVGYVTNGYFGQNDPSGGMPVAQNPDKVSGYYKYTPNGPDTALAGIFLYRYDAVADSTILVEKVAIPLLPASTYTYFEMQSLYNGWNFVDTMNIAFASSNFDSIPKYIGMGSVLIIDNLTVTYKPLSVNEIQADGRLRLSPLPAGQAINITSDEPLLKNNDFTMMDLSGQVVYRQKVEAQHFTVDVSRFPSGIYFYAVTTVKGETLKGKLAVSR